MRFRMALGLCGLFILLILLSGCETVKGTLSGGAEGLSQDWQNAQKIDGWIKENLW